MIKLNKKFFQQYHLEIEKKKREIQTLKPEDSIHFKDNVAETKNNISQKLYPMTCNHLFPRENEHAQNRDLEVIGDCVLTNRDKGCDFAAIEIKESYSDSCDVSFRRDDKKKINANVYSNRLKIENIIHKIGATTDVTKGRIVSSEFDLDDWENIFLVKGTAGKFSDQGYSGSLVFGRPTRIEQTLYDIN